MADDQRTPPPLEVLYDEDFYVWTQDQAAAIRAAAETGMLPVTLDWERLSEEVGDLGKRDHRECLSRVRQILLHLWKLDGSRRAEPRGHWRAEIVAQRNDLERVISNSLRRMVAVELEGLHRQAVRLAALSFETEEPAALPLDASKRWTIEQILGETDDPLA